MIIVFVGSRFLLPLSDHDAVIRCRDFCLVQASSKQESRPTRNTVRTTATDWSSKQIFSFHSHVLDKPMALIV